MGSADELPVGSWTVALGHPGGYQKDRPPVVRVGRILAKGTDFVLTDNTLVGGDSGGPLFDLDGRVIGIHSKIEVNIARNVHVPADRFLEDWDTLVDSQDVGGRELPEWMRRGSSAVDGLNFDATDVGVGGARVLRVAPQSPAQAAGFLVNDRIISMNGTPVNNGQEIMLRRMGLRAGVAVTYQVRRGQETLELELTPVTREDLRRPEYRRETDPLRPVLGIIPDQRYPGPGVRLEGVQDKGPAMMAGLQGGDILMSFNGQFLRNGGEMTELTSRLEVGDVVKLGVSRGDQKLDVELKLGAFRDVFPENRQR
jgi:S1-C subfamily serine protease